MEKILTITVPAYNAAKYLGKCLDSLLTTDRTENPEPDNRLEIIVINDGSTDETGQIAQAYVNRFPDLVRLVNKENGGHGSGINAGLDAAAGRYFKVVDADDRIISGNLKPVLDILEKMAADVVVTGYVSENERSGKVQSYHAAVSGPEPECLSMEQFAAVFDQMPAAFQFHGLCYDTSFFRSLDIRMSEHLFYEDQEYAILPFLKAEKILLLPYDFYIYRIGASDQSVSFANLDKRLADMKAVLLKLMDAHKQGAGTPGWTPDRELFFVKRLSIAVTSFYAVMLVKSKDRKEGKKQAEDFRQFLEREEPAIARYTEGRYKTLQKIGNIPAAAGLYTHFSDSDFFIRFKKIWNR